MVIKASSARQIDALVSDLGSGEVARREAAEARLTILGSRAVERLVAALESTAAPSIRIMVINTLAAIADPRALAPALHATGDEDEGVAVAAVSASRVFLRGARGASVVDRLTTIALDRARAAPVRVAAIQVLTSLEPSTVAPLLAALRDDPNGTIRAASHSTASRGQPEPRDALDDGHGLSADPARMRQAMAQATGASPLATLLRGVEHARERETAEPGYAADWMAVRGAAHVALASRGSRLAVYDLRESLEKATGPLPADFLAALTRVGDVSCLEPIVAAYVRARDAGGSARAGARGLWWRQQLADAFRAIVAREHVARMSAAMKKIEKKWPGTAKALVG